MTPEEYDTTVTDKGKQLSQIWSDGFMAIGRMYCEAWKENRLNAKNLAFLSGVRETMLTVYHEAIRLGLCDKIESISQEDKQGLWDIVQGYGKELSKKEQVNFARVLWCINNFL